MKGWIIYKGHEQELKPETYEMERLIQEAKLNDIDLEIVNPDHIDLVVSSESRNKIAIRGEYQNLPDFILPRMGAGTTYFAFAVIRHLERLGVPAINASEGIDIVKDKLYTQQILAENNLPSPKTMLVKFPIDVNMIEKTLGFPVVVKTISGSQGKGVFLSENKKAFADLMQLLESTSPNLNIILQEFVANSFGKDLRVFTIGGRAVACMQRTAQSNEFKANFSAGASVESYPLTPEIEWLATETSRVFGLDIAGIDLLFDGDHFKICEVNSSPGFEGLESCCQVDIANEIFNYLRLRFATLGTSM